jgi:hypothetical protein
MIEGRPEVVHAVSEEQRPTGHVRDGLEHQVVGEHGGFRVLVKGQACALFLGPPANLLIEGPEVFFGPRNSREGTVKGVRHA